MDTPAIIFLTMWALCGCSMLILAPFEIELRSSNLTSFLWLGLPIRRRTFSEPYGSIRERLSNVDRVHVVDAGSDQSVFVVHTFRKTTSAGFIRGVIRKREDSTQLVCHFPIGLALTFVSFMIGSSTFAFSKDVVPESGGMWLFLLFMNGLPAGMWYVMHRIAVDECDTVFSGIHELISPVNDENAIGEIVSSELSIDPRFEARYDGTRPGWRGAISIETIAGVLLVLFGLILFTDSREGHAIWGIWLLAIGGLVIIIGLRPAFTTKDLFIKVSPREIAIEGVRSSHRIPVAEIERVVIPDFHDTDKRCTDKRGNVLYDQVCFVMTDRECAIGTYDVYLTDLQQRQFQQHVQALLKSRTGLEAE